MVKISKFFACSAYRYCRRNVFLLEFVNNAQKQDRRIFFKNCKFQIFKKWGIFKNFRPRSLWSNSSKFRQKINQNLYFLVKNTKIFSILIQFNIELNNIQSKLFTYQDYFELRLKPQTPKNFAIIGFSIVNFFSIIINISGHPL